MADSNGDMASEVNEGNMTVAPYGSSTSANVTFSGTNMSQLDLTPPSSNNEDSAVQASPTTSSSSSSSSILTNSLRELGDDAVWLLSSAKVGNGIEQLRDNDPLTFWQSDGLLPHSITIQFHKKTRVSCVAIYLDQKLDESYSPSRISIRVGNGSPSGVVPADLSGNNGSASSSGSAEIREVDRFELEDPQGWMVCHLMRPDGDAAGGETGAKLNPIRCHFLQIVVLNSYQNGRDTHVRQVKIFGPRNSAPTGLQAEMEKFSTVEFQQFTCIR